MSDNETTNSVRAVFVDHGISEERLSCRQEADPLERWWCPSCNSNAFETARALSQHHSIAHRQSVVEGICGTETWESIAAELYIDRGFALDTIATKLPGHTGAHSVTNDFHRLGVRERPTSPHDFETTDTSTDKPKVSCGQRQDHSLVKRLSDMSVEEFDAIAGTGGDV